MSDHPPRVTQEQWDALDAAGEQVIAARLSRIQLMKRHNIEGITITNETTASQPTTCGACGANEGERCRTMSDDRCDAGKHVSSQPKSIGDDAQFHDLLAAYVETLRKTHGYVPAFNALAAYIDSRAPAAQASATIQAAPDDIPSTMEDARKLIQYLRIENDSKVMELYDIKKKLAATIQEPVMVAEPVGKRPISKEWSLKAAQAEQDSGVAGIGAGAAPMVADPAGVDSMRAAFEAQANIVNKGRMPNGTYNSIGTEALWQNFAVAYRAGLAATVKAVPSEALDTKRLDWLMANNSDYSVKIRGQEKYGWFIHDPWRDISSSYFSTSREAIDAAIAAPLADKTGGGE